MRYHFNYFYETILDLMNVLLIEDPFKQRLERQISEYLDIVVELMGASFISLAMQLRGKRWPQWLQRIFQKRDAIVSIYDEPWSSECQKLYLVS